MSVRPRRCAPAAVAPLAQRAEQKGAAASAALAQCAGSGAGGAGPAAKGRQRGISLVELIVAMVLISVGVAGLLSVTSSTIQHSADPMVRKQALIIAESLLTEIEQQPFTFCDPQDANVLTAKSATVATDCTNDQNKGDAAFPAPGSPMAPTPSTESRGSVSDPYDNVADYAGFRATGKAITGIDALADYTASVTITRVGAAGTFSALPLGAVLEIRIEVGVTGSDETVVLTGYRVRYAPNSPG